MAVVSDGAGNLYVADSVNGTIRKIVIATGAVTTLAGNARQTGTVDGIGAAATFSDLKSIASDGAGNLYVADGTAIRQIVMASGAVTTLADDTGAPVEMRRALRHRQRRGGLSVRRQHHDPQRHHRQHHPEDLHRDRDRHHLGGPD